MALLELNRTNIRQITKVEEYYNSITANIQFSGAELRVILLTSAQPNEGKTTSSVGISLSLAQAGYKTLLIDADIRNSVLSGIFTARGKIEGLTSYLSGNAGLGEAICKTNVANLFVIPSGKHAPNPTRLIQNDRFAYILDKTREVFDYIIIDSPPVGLVVDAAVMSQKCDGFALVAAADKTKRRFLLKAKQQMEMSGAQFLGIIVNQLAMKQIEYGGYGSYGTYGSYGKTDDNSLAKHRRILKKD